VLSVQATGQGLRPPFGDAGPHPGLLDDPHGGQARLAAFARQPPQEVVRAHEEATHPSPKYGPWCGPDKAILGSGRALLHGRALANLEAMTVTVGARQQGRPLAVATEIPRFEALAVIRPRGRDHLGRIAGHEHVAAHARRGALHRHIRDVLQNLIVVHGSYHLSWETRSPVPQ